jgi:hypothetical protein
MFRYNRKGQSVLEYAVLLGVVIAGILIMQMFMKRGFQGQLKSSSDEISGGQSFSASSTTTSQGATMQGNQVTTQEVGTGSTIKSFGAPAIGTISKGAYTYQKTEGGSITSTSEAKTDAATNEAVKWNEHPSSTAGGDYDISEVR